MTYILYFGKTKACDWLNAALTYTENSKIFFTFDEMKQMTEYYKNVRILRQQTKVRGRLQLIIKNFTQSKIYAKQHILKQKDKKISRGKYISKFKPRYET